MVDDGLLTVLHISDLHFNNKIGGLHVGPYDARLPKLLTLYERFDGLLGHHYKALSALDQFRRSLGDDEPILLSVTGDLTANGARAQFDLAQWFLSTRGQGTNIGLGHTTWQELSVPGNHDHWPGKNVILGRPTTALSQYFPGPYPIMPPPMTLKSGHSVRFLLINSDEEVNPFLHDRFLARGSFVNQLAKLSNQLPPRKENEIRVLIVHHSMMPQPPQSSTSATPARFDICGITPGTRKVLETFLVDGDVSVVLCGHRHTARLSLITASNGVQNSHTLEARCGTTTQLDKYPYRILRKIKKNRMLPPNTLIKHRLVERGGDVYWTSQIFWLSKNARFVTVVPHVSSLLPQKLKEEIRVLPRP